MRVLLIVLSLLSVVACAESPGPADDMADSKADGTQQSGLRSGTHAWTCTNINSGAVVAELRHAGSRVLDASLHDYHVIEDGVQREDSDIGPAVFNVEASEVEFPSASELTFSLALQDYSEVSTWKLAVHADGSGTMDWTFQSSDGDGQLHEHSDRLACEDNAAN